MTNEKYIEYAFTWFDEEQWKLLKELDPEGLDDTYEEWRNNASKAFSDFQRNGQRIRKIAIDSIKFKNWCEENNLETNGKARAEYASYLLSELKKK